MVDAVGGTALDGRPLLLVSETAPPELVAPVDELVAVASVVPATEVSAPPLELVVATVPMLDPLLPEPVPPAEVPDVTPLVDGLL